MCAGFKTFRSKALRRRSNSVPAAGDAAIGDAHAGIPEVLAIATPFARKTRWVDEIFRLFGHAAGGWVSERLLGGLGVRVSDTSILRRCRGHARQSHANEPPRVVAIDDWSWRKGFAYGTIVVDVERRKSGTPGPGPALGIGRFRAIRRLSGSGWSAHWRPAIFPFDRDGESRGRAGQGFWLVCLYIGASSRG